MKLLKDVLYQPINETIMTQHVVDNIHSREMPNILILQRKNIRQISNGVKVALYYAPKINKYISIPYDSIHEGVDETFNENIIDKLNDIIAYGTKRIIFEDGSSEKVEIKVAKAILDVYVNLTENNRYKISCMANKNKNNFQKVVDFAWKNVNKQD